MDDKSHEPKFNKFTERAGNTIQAIFVILVSTIGGLLYANIGDVQELNYRIKASEKEIKRTQISHEEIKEWQKKIEEKLTEQQITMEVIKAETKLTNDLLRKK